MSTDWADSATDLDTDYDVVLSNLKGRDIDAVTLNAAADATNVPINTVWFDRATKTFKNFNGSTWDIVAIEVAGGGTGATTAAGARTNLGLGTMAIQNAGAVAISGGAISGLTSLSVSGPIVTTSTSATSIDTGGGIRAGSGAVGIVNAAGKIPALTTAYFASVDGSAITALNASQLASGTVPDARFPATLPVASGVNLTNLNATNLASGTVADARLSSNIPLKNAANVFTANQQISADLLVDNDLSVLGDSQVATSSSLTGPAARSLDTVYQAGSDGFLFGYLYGSGFDGSATIEIRSDSSDPPTTVMGIVVATAVGINVPFCTPIKKGNFYKIVTISGTPAGLFDWISLGTAG